ncbi:thiol:disulfide interchange protein DsbA/DsbL [Ectothiorhodospiraceae bacterium BW-2]|nr:thiol:disulfide interchange protein DsbA/DsbL [Ectothiorhodospiraceae bacterium BW-2]
MLRLIPWLILSLLALPLWAAEEEEFIEGIHYERVTPPLPGGSAGKVEVIELFWYGCPHCFTFEPKLAAWKKRKADYIEFISVPAIFNNPLWQLHATAFYTADILGVEGQLHEALFRALHVTKRPLKTEQQLRDFFIEHGIKGEAFDKTFNSFSVRAKTARAADLSKKSGINGVPAVVVNGKFRIDGPLAGGYDNLLKIVDRLAEQEHLAATK